MPGAIIQLVDSRYGGGIETHILQLSVALKQQGYSVQVALMRDYGPHPLKKQLDCAGIPWWIAPRNIFDCMSKFQRTAALINTHGYKAGIIGRLFARIAGIPVVSTYHSGDQGRGRVRVYHWLDQLTSHLAPAMAVSDQIAEQLPTKPHRIQNFVAPQPDHLNHTGQSIAFVGRLAHEKGPDLFCQAIEAAHLRSGIVYGDGPLKSILRQRYGNPIRFCGFVENMAPYWPSIGLLCISSRAEGLPLVALEAMSRGIPVAAFAVGGLPQLIEHNRDGFLVAPGDVQGLTDTLTRWSSMSLEQRQKLSNAARQKIEKDYSCRAALPGILSVYHQAASTLLKAV